MLGPESFQPWREIARPNQLPPVGSWRIWLLLAGRGFGKTRSGAELVHEWARSGVKRIALVGATAADVRDVMVEGESGIMACASPDFRPVYEPSKRRITWPNGCIATTYTADEPERLRGPQHEKAWCDELCAWRYVSAWDMLMFGLRLGDDPQCVVTTTPKPVKLLKDVKKLPLCVVTRGSTYDNRDNLADAFFDSIITKYEGTHLGDQELRGLDIEDNPNSLFKRSDIDQYRIFPQQIPKQDDIRFIVIAIDPAFTSKEDIRQNNEPDMTGIIIACCDTKGHAYIIKDLSNYHSPLKWAATAIKYYHQLKANWIAYECNTIGEMPKATILAQDQTVRVVQVRASRGKYTRAEPVSLLYEQGKVHHVGRLSELEEEMCSWEPGMDSPNRMDALVWAIISMGLCANPGEKLKQNSRFQQAERSRWQGELDDEDDD